MFFDQLNIVEIVVPELFLAYQIRHQRLPDFCEVFVEDHHNLRHKVPLVELEVKLPTILGLCADQFVSLP